MSSWVSFSEDSLCNACDGEIVLYCKYFVRYFVSSNSVCCDECLHQSQFEHMLSVNTMFLESNVCWAEKLVNSSLLWSVYMGCSVQIIEWCFMASMWMCSMWMRESVVNLYHILCSYILRYCRSKAGGVFFVFLEWRVQWACVSNSTDSTYVISFYLYYIPMILI